MRFKKPSVDWFAYSLNPVRFVKGRPKHSRQPVAASKSQSTTSIVSFQTRLANQIYSLVSIGPSVPVERAGLKSPKAVQQPSQMGFWLFSGCPLATEGWDEYDANPGPNSVQTAGLE